MKAKNFLIITIISITLFAGCKDKLDRYTAHTMIENCIKTDCKNSFICKVSVRQNWISNYYNDGKFCTVVVTNSPRQDEAEQINYFINKGLIRIETEQIDKDCGHWTKNIVIITEKGKKYLIKDENNKYVFVTAKFTIEEVTGVFQPDEVTANVEYNVKKNETTPFGEFFNTFCVDTKKTYNKSFFFYDDGWRLKK